MEANVNLLLIYDGLLSKYNNQKWWPGETPFEVIIGAILTQSVSWTNVEKAIKNLKEEGILEPDSFHKKEVSEIAPLIKSSLYYNEKAKKIKNFINFFFDEYDGSIKKMSDEDIIILRQKLLKIKGLGEETVDSILLYACDKPIFVVDAYTKRIFSRFGFFKETTSYKDIQLFFMGNLPRNIKLYNDYHAQIVHLGKNICKNLPKCNLCPIRELNDTMKCQYADNKIYASSSSKKKRGTIKKIRYPKAGF
jgi:endonuclease-3 related protein